jgi:hypothetical protein
VIPTKLVTDSRSKMKILLMHLNLCKFWKIQNLIFIFNPLNAELNPICHLLALLGVHHILHVSRIRVKTFISLFSDFINTFIYTYLFMCISCTTFCTLCIKKSILRVPLLIEFLNNDASVIYFRRCSLVLGLSMPPWMYSGETILFFLSHGNKFYFKCPV